MSWLAAPSRRITLTIRNADWPTWLPTTTGIVLVDGQRRSYLVGGRIRRISLAPGKHTIGVMRFGSTVEFGPVTIQEGDRLDLICGKVGSGCPPQLLLGRVLIVACWILAGICGAIVLPEFRRSLLTAALFLPPLPPFSTLLDKAILFATSTLGGFLLVVAAICVAIPLPQGTLPRTKPYYLMRRADNKKPVVLGEL